MKIRIRGNSVRYRLTKSEVEAFCREGYFEEKTHFESKNFIYKLEAKSDIDQLYADFECDMITLYINTELCSNWHKDDRVGFGGTMITKNGNSISLLLEKDFICMDETVEDQSDNYPNPKVQ